MPNGGIYFKRLKSDNDSIDSYERRNAIVMKHINIGVFQLFAKSSSSTSSTTKSSSSTNSSSSTKSGSTSGSNTSSSSNTTGSSSTSGSSYTTGGSSSSSHSHTEGSSHSTTNTQGGSQSDTTSQGGANSQTNGKTWASGVVDADVVQNKKKYENEYQQSQQVTDTYNRLQDTLNNKPGAFSSSYTDKLNSLYDQLMNREKFSYNFNADPMYKMYAEKYTQQGKQAMQDTMGQAAALTGGYSSSYSQTAGQQTYQNYLQQLNDMIPELRNQAYQEWQAEGEDLKDKYNLTQNAYNNEYERYRDTVSDWQQDRSFDQSDYQQERNFDYSKYSDNRSYFQNEYWNQRNAETSNSSNTDQTNWSKAHTNENNWSTSETNSQYSSDTDTYTTSSNWSNTQSNSNTVSNSATTGNSATSSWQNSWSNTNQSSTTNGTSTTNSTTNADDGKTSSSSTSALSKILNGDFTSKKTGTTEAGVHNSQLKLNNMYSKLDNMSATQAENAINNWLQHGFEGTNFTEQDAALALMYMKSLSNGGNASTLKQPIAVSNKWSTAYHASHNN